MGELPIIYQRDSRKGAWMKRVFIPICIIGICSIFLGFSADCQVPHLEKGIELYKQEKYEEAVDV